MEQIIEGYKRLIAELQELYLKKQNNIGNTGIEILNRLLIDKRVAQINDELDSLRERELMIKDAESKFPHCLNEEPVKQVQTKKRGK